jgi:hypothetical protein
MATRGNAVVIHARACAYAAHMGSRSDTVFAHVCTNTNSQDVNIRADGMGRDRRKKSEGIERGSEKFHRGYPA